MRATVVFVAALGMALSGCGNVIVDGSGSGTTSSTTTGTSSTTTGTSSTTTSTSSTTTSTSSASPTWALVVKNAAVTPCSHNAFVNPPGAVFLLLANQPITCGQPMPSDIPLFPTPDPANCPATAAIEFEVCFALPPSSLVPGGTFDLTYPVSPGHNIEAAANDSKDCSVGQVDAQGTLQVSAVDPSSVALTLSFSDFVIPGWTPTTIVTSGDYKAELCP